MAIGQKDTGKAQTASMRAYRFCGNPTEEQAHLLHQFAGSCRFLWNRMLADEQAHYQETGEHRLLPPSFYKKIKGLEWLKDMDSLALCNVQLHLDRAFRRFFNGISGKSNPVGSPKFKSKHKCTDSYTTNVVGKNIKLDGCMLKLPKIKTPIPLCLHRKIQKGGTLKSVTVTYEPSGKWYFSLLYEYPQQVKKSFDKSQEVKHIGLDMSLPKLYVDSNGEEADFFKAYHALEKRIGREQRKLAHMQKGSQNYKKQKQRIAKLYAKAKHQRQDRLHKLSYRLTEQYDLISIEDLNMAAMKKSLHFGKSVSDNGWGMFVEMLQYKAVWKGKHIIKVSKWFPSSKTCSRCGYIHKELQLSDREYICPHCGHMMDRDHQAAINIDREGLRLFLSA